MAPRLTIEQVSELAPDPSSLSAARGLATPATWTHAGCSESAVWGLAKGSGKKPYQAAVDLSGPAYKCSCPSRKIPCKHVLGLLLLWADGAVPEGATLAFVDEWLAARSERAESAQVRSEQRATADADPAAKAKRQDKRAANISAGVDELERILSDLIRHGLAAAREQPASTWDRHARRLVDAQAPALGARVRRLGETLHAGGDHWSRRALEEAAMLHLAIAAWRRRDVLPADLRDDLRAVVGWPISSEELRASGSPEVGPWAVVGIRLASRDHLRIRRTWLLREADEQLALLLDFAPVQAPLPPPLITGTVVDGPVLRYPGRGSLRVQPDGDLTTIGPWSGPATSASIEAALMSWGAALASDPFVEQLPVTLAAVTPVRVDGTWWVREASGVALPVTGPGVWDLVSLAGGQPISLVSEFNGRALHALAAFSDGRLWRLGHARNAEAA